MTENEDKVCCMCNEKKKFLGRMNAGKKYYCIKCEAKINKSGMDYWKPCSSVEFFENMSSEWKNGDYRKPNMFRNMRKVLQEADKEDNRD